jgi:hypothetical protein
MKIIGCDFHPGYQQIAVLDLATGEIALVAEKRFRAKEKNFPASTRRSVS